MRRVIRIESRGNPGLIVRGNYGLMQIRLGTARAMGYTGSPQGLLDPDTNMTYAVKYLAGAYRTAGCNPDRAIANYQRGYRRKARAKCPTPPEQTQVAKAETEKAKPRSVVEDRMVLAQSRSKPAPESETAPATDVLKPKIVHTVAVPKLVAPPAPKPLVPVQATSKAATATPPEQTPTAPKPQLVPTKSNESTKSDKVATPVLQASKAEVPLPKPGPGRAAAVKPLDNPVAPAPQTQTVSAPPPEPVPAKPVASEVAEKSVAPASDAGKSATTGMLANVESESAAEPPAKTPDVLPPPKPERQAEPAPATRHASKRHHGRKKAEKPTNLLALLKKLVTPDKKTGRKHRSRTQQAQR